MEPRANAYTLFLDMFYKFSQLLFVLNENISFDIFFIGICFQGIHIFSRYQYGVRKLYVERIFFYSLYYVKNFDFHFST